MRASLYPNRNSNLDPTNQATTEHLTPTAPTIGSSADQSRPPPQRPRRPMMRSTRDAAGSFRPGC